MAEAAPRSLLDFAITASAAVLPVMLAVLLLVAVVRPADDARAALGGRQPADRYASVRHVAALKTFESAVVPRTALPPAGPGLSTTPATPTAADVAAALPACAREWRDTDIAAQLAAFDAALSRFSSRSNARVVQAVGLDAARWFSAAQAGLAAAIETPLYPGQRFRLGCADLAAALAALSRADGRLLEALAWRGTVTASTLARWAPQQQMAVDARHVMRRNPWNGIAGCIYLGSADAGAGPAHFIARATTAQARLCALPAMAGTASPAAAVDTATAVDTTAVINAAAAVDSAALASAASAPSALPGEPGPDIAVDDARWRVPPSLFTMLEPLEALRQPSRPLYRLYTEASEAGPADAAPSSYRHGPNRLVFEGSDIDVGFSLRLTIDPALQARAQQIAACYTGRHDVCRALGVHRAEDAGKPLGHALLEGAMVRLAAVAVIDVASGRIEALAGALSRCARQEVDGPGRDAQCDARLPYAVRYRPDALLNPAVYHDAMPASTIKPIMAAAFLSDADNGKRWLATERAAMNRAGAPARDSLRGQLMRSDSARFLDRMLCIDNGAQPCRRPWDVQAMAQTLGWNAACSTPAGAAGLAAAAGADCGRHDLLFGRAVNATAEAGQVQPLATRVAYGRLMSEPVASRLGAAMHLRPPSALDTGILRRCAAGADGTRGSDDDWEKCRGGAVVDVVAEGWGQGHARASALGVAGMVATLAAAANGQAAVRRPYLVEGLQGVGGSTLQPAVARWGLAAPQPLALSQDAAEVILSGLSYSHREGTARSACEQVFDARRCRGIDWLAGKTGTPSFPSDGIPLAELATLCRGTPPPERAAACGALRPYKWYVAAYRADGSGHGPWTKVIAVLAERNWLRKSGIVHGAGDRGPNPAAEIALQIAGRQVGALSASPGASINGSSP
ncbi:hypothetical protein [Aquabacterium sp.]|uniref:hypothetical protein n=1 Tax=Aquabacterium sp. TaxID=1872578 RepID=UPI002B8CA78D|nr:hypothetical protein [Aquabacterium sp.]HSW08584.1 hypothetical protein [Aquabacterium sp.]